MDYQTKAKRHSKPNHSRIHGHIPKVGPDVVVQVQKDRNRSHANQTWKKTCSYYNPRKGADLQGVEGKRRSVRHILEQILDSKYARHIPHNRIHGVLKEMNLASDEPKKQRKKKWIRYERKYSNSLWHTDWKYLDGSGWLIAYLDDASRFVVSYGLFDSATSENTVKVLKEAIRKYGRPAAILSDRGSQFYATEAEEKTKGATLFERFLVEQGIGQRLSRVRHPQTNGKVERFFRTVQDKMEWFEGDLDRLMVWYNYRRPHMSLNLKKIETPYEAYQRKMPEPGTVIDEQSGEIYDVKE